MSSGRASLIKMGTFAGVTLVAAASHFSGLGEHATGVLGTVLALGSEGALALAGHLGVHLLDAGIEKYASAEEHARKTQNHDLHRLVGETIARVLDRQADHAPGGKVGREYLMEAAAAFRGPEWMTAETSGNESVISEPELAMYFSGDPEQIKAAPVLEEDEWVGLVRKALGGASLIRERDEALRYAAKTLRSNFAFELWEAAKSAWLTDDLAWPALTLRFLSLILGNTDNPVKSSRVTVAQGSEIQSQLKTRS